MGLEKIFGDGRKACYKDSYKRISKYLSHYIKDERCFAEIASVLLLVVDLSVYKNNKNRQAVADLLYPEAVKLTGKSQNYLLSRVSFYSQFIRGKQPRADYCFGNGNIDDPLLRVVVALGDTVFNSDLIDDYDNAPVLLTGIDVNMKYFNVMRNDVSREIAFLFDFEGKRHW